MIITNQIIQKYSDIAYVMWDSKAVTQKNHRLWDNKLEANILRNIADKLETDIKNDCI